MVNQPDDLIKGGPMKKDFGLVQLKTIKGEPIEHMDLIMRPVSQSLIIRLPFSGFVWNRPAAVEIDEAGKLRRIPIVDVTLLAQISLFISSLVAAGIVHLINRRMKSNSK